MFTFTVRVTDQSSQPQTDTRAVTVTIPSAVEQIGATIYGQTATFGNGVRLAERITAQVTGTVQSMPGSGLVGNWTIAGKNVQADASTEFDQENGTIGVGAVVTVEGTLQGDGSVLDSGAAGKTLRPRPSRTGVRLDVPVPAEVAR